MQQTEPLSDKPSADLDFVPGTLESTIVQVIFPEIADIDNAKAVTPFQDRIRHDYPFMRQDRLSGPAGDITVWRYIDLAQRWTVSLSRNSIALETRDFRNRAELVERLSSVLSAMNEVFRPTAVDRIGVRHVARGPALSDNERSPLARTELSGLYAAFPSAHLALNEVHLFTAEGGITVRHGKLPPGFSPAADVIFPRPETTWVLDVDSYTIRRDGDEAVPFETPATARTASALSARAAMAATACGDMDFSHPTALPAAATRH